MRPVADPQASSGLGESASANDVNPYKGPSSFEIEDEHLFFGRDQEATTLSRRILGSRMVVLHAPSGAGKTSLLNARIIPMLERQRWVVVRIRPERNPLLAVRTGVVDCLLPELATERFALERALRLLGAPPTIPFSDLVARYQSSPAGVRNREVIAPVLLSDADASAATLGVGSKLRRPHVCRALRRTIEPADVLRLWTWIRQWGSPNASVGALTPDVLVHRLMDLLSPRPEARAEDGDTLDKSYRRLRPLLNPRAWSLRDFFQQLATFLEQTRFGCGFVLLLDQFEEIFTRFRDDSGGAASRDLLPDWRLRPQFFAELERLYRDDANDAETGGEPQQMPSRLPIRYVISLRDEWVARLGPVWRFAPESVKSVVRIDFLAPDQAREAIEAPVLLHGLSYEPSCINRVVEDLTVEADQLVDPGRLQIVCGKLWESRVRSAVPDRKEPPIAITGGILEELGGTGEILRKFFSAYLRTLAREFSATPEKLPDVDATARESFVRLEVLDLLDPLVTPSGTRNKVSRERLLNAPFRYADIRKHFLDCLERERIIRKEPTGDGDFYEITHEFLLLPIRDEIYREPQFDGLARALRALLSRLEEDPYARLPKELFFVLDRHKRLFDWDVDSAEVLLRNAVIHDGDGQIVKDWAQRFDEIVEAERKAREQRSADEPARPSRVTSKHARYVTQVVLARALAEPASDGDASMTLLRTLIRRPGRLTSERLGTSNALR